MGEGRVGGSGLPLLGKFPGLFETEVTGRRGPFGSCQGVLLSQNRTILPQTLHSIQFPPSAPDFLIRLAASGRADEGTERGAGGCVRKGHRWVQGREAGKNPPLSHSPSTFDF